MSIADRHELAFPLDVGLGGARPPGAHREGDSLLRVRTIRRWAVGVLALATVALFAYAAVLLVAMSLLVFFWNGLSGGGPASLDAVAVARSLAPVLLVGWCSGLASSAALSGGEVIGPRTAGILSGAVGVLAGGLVMAMTDLL
ncbi:MAG: hypothetical protein ABIQ61_07085 [Ornithinibacter sp.]